VTVGEHSIAASGVRKMGTDSASLSDIAETWSSLSRILKIKYPIEWKVPPSTIALPNVSPATDAQLL
jgi:hypothetical protein